MTHLGYAWGGMAVLSLLLMGFARGLGMLLFLAGSGVVLYCGFHLILAKGRALSSGDAQIWNGLARVISWNPTEGILLLKNKSVHFVDDDTSDGGGVRVIYPLLGEEVALRIPLEIQTLPIADSGILTQEYIPLSIKGTIYWKICDLNQYYLNVSKEIHSVNDRGGHLLQAAARNPKFEVAEQWLRAMAEEKTRSVVSRVGTGLLMADQLSADLSHTLPGTDRAGSAVPESSPGYRGATDSLASTIKMEFGESARAYGLEIHEVRLQEVNLPPEIYEAAVAACKSAYLPLKARGEAIQRKMMLQAEVDTIGKDAAGLSMVAGNIPPLAFQEFLAPLFLDFNRKRGLSRSGE